MSEAGENDQNSESTPKVGELVPQAHGGALRHGGTNKGGPGRPPSAVRAVCSEAFEESIPILKAIRDDPGARDSDRLKAVDLLGKYGGIEQLEVKVERREPRITAERASLVYDQFRRMQSIEEIERMLVSSVANGGSEEGLTESESVDG